MPLPPPGPDIPLVDDDALAHLAGEQAWSLLAGLGDGERSAIVFAYFGGYTYRQIAVLVAQPEGTIKSRLRSGLSQLRHQMGSINTATHPCGSETP